MSCGGLVLDTQGVVLGMNDTAEKILRRETALSAQVDGSTWSREALKRLLARAGARFRVDQEAWITVQHDEGAPLVLHAIPLANGGSPLAEDGTPGANGAHTMLVMVDLSQRPRPGPSVLQRLFDLTPAEARLAIEIGSGRTLQEVSDDTKLSNATLRTQLSSVFQKTNTRRQPELVALLARVAILP